MQTDAITSDAAKALLLAWLFFAYVAYIGMGALPSDKAPYRRTPRRVIIDRCIFFIAFLPAPLLTFTLLGLELPGVSVLSFGNSATWILPGLGITAVAFAVGFFSKKTASEVANYPQYLPKTWKPSTLALEIASWFLYLLAYEFAFRGIILYLLAPLGFWTAIATHTGLYAFAHLPKSAKEASGALAFGIATALMTLAWGTIIPAFLSHLALALANDISCYCLLQKSRVAV